MPTVQSGHASIRFQVHGEGPPLLLIAGTGYPGATWPPELVTTLSKDFATIVFDHRGTGLSSGTDDAYTTRLFAADAAAVLRDIGAGPTHVIGHSMGGRVAQWLAIDAGNLVKSLVLASSGSGHHNGRQQIVPGIPIATVLDLVELGYERFIRERQRRTFFTEQFVKDSSDEVQWLGDAFWNHRPTLAEYLKHVVARQEHDTSGVLGRLIQPTLVVVGELDTHPGDTGSHLEQATYLVNQLQLATLKVVPAMKHGFFWEDPRSSIKTICSWLMEHRLAVD